ncbi:hypothetical protein CC86DRAFT_13556 [Ophiobolus disseminans]|uniref:Uncharacterized protein n=1 Tax=Ophiobolus disseminans TaxID=1469910 RepID=A0A6A7AKA8_9PLEO|nr:hypothetical protein CC86DRAFT_13556 [Ophiobolus disseminans]
MRVKAYLDRKSKHAMHDAIQVNGWVRHNVSDMPGLIFRCLAKRTAVSTTACDVSRFERLAIATGIIAICSCQHPPPFNTASQPTPVGIFAIWMSILNQSKTQPSRAPPPCSYSRTPPTHFSPPSPYVKSSAQTIRFKHRLAWKLPVYQSPLANLVKSAGYAQITGEADPQLVGWGRKDVPGECLTSRSCRLTARSSLHTPPVSRISFSSPVRTPLPLHTPCRLIPLPGANDEIFPSLGPSRGWLPRLYAILCTFRFTSSGWMHVMEWNSRHSTQIFCDAALAGT